MRERAVQLQGILLPDAAVCGVEELYYHKNGNRTDFNGYFNLFYIEKRKRYTDIHNLYLDIRLQGYSSLVLVHDGKDIGKVGLDASELREYRIQFPYGKYKDGCFWVALVGEEAGCREDARRTVPADANRPPKGSAAGTGQAEDKPARVVSSFYITEPSPDRVREVRIGAVICTYRREAYVERNLRQMKERVLGRAELDVSSRVKLYIIDNGRTLDRNEAVRELAADCGGRVVILPNRNAGGAGGFTRGMIEVLRAKEREGFTHVLLMDDDAVFEPDAFVRIHGLAATLKENWKDITIGGAMLREDFPYVLYCAGEHWDSAQAMQDEKNLDVRSYRQATKMYLTGTENEKELYSGWWLCCYSLNMVRPDNLPLPIFIHGDDVELGHRYRSAGIVFLNGISVWHRGFEVSFSGTNVYYLRNKLITLSICQEQGGRRMAAGTVLKSFFAMILRSRYDEAQIIYKGVGDFIRGPGWLYHQNAEKLNEQICKMVPPRVLVKCLEGQVSDIEYKSILNQIKEYQDDYGMETLNRYWSQKKKSLPLQFWTMLKGFLKTKGQIKVIFPTDAPYEGFFKQEKVYYEIGSPSVQLFKTDCKKIIFCLWMCLKAEARILLYFNVAAGAYRKYLPQITSQRAWERYLGIYD